MPDQIPAGFPAAAVSAADIERAAALLDAGELVAFPTETVYGLGGDAESAQAVARIYAAKGRPANHPVIVHLAPQGDPAYWVESLPADAQKLIDAFWPGPLTLILKRAAHIPAAVSGGQDSVGLRCPSHPVAQALLAATAHVAEEKVIEARKRLTAAIEKGKETWNNVQEKAIAGAKATDQVIRENPYKALGIALGVGAIIGYLLRRRD